MVKVNITDTMDTGSDKEQLKREVQDLALLARRFIFRLSRHRLEVEDSKLIAKTWDYLRKHDLMGNCWRESTASRPERKEPQ